MTARLHLHLDPIGGIAGDMFVGALLDAWPDLAEGAIVAVRQAGLGDDVRIEHRAHRDEVLVGSRFVVVLEESEEPGHEHVHWRTLKERLSASRLDAGVCERALAIFSLLAEAEAFVHGVDVDDATFHEVGAWDSIADIVAAAFLIETLGADHWSVGPLPLGGGRVRSAHGDLPVPAPATAQLLQGFTFHDDGRSGERVTPTGAAILKYLTKDLETEAGAKRLLKTGHGFGLRKLDGISNVLRVVAFKTAQADVVTRPDSADMTDSVGVLTFEIDDQTSEDLAIGLDRLRAQDGILDIVQMPVVGKKGRLSTSLRMLTRVDAVDRAIAACFAETTTLGVRWHIERRAILARHEASAGDIAVKLASRPGGRMTAKAESDALRGLSGQAAREEARRSAETKALARDRGEENNG